MTAWTEQHPIKLHHLHTQTKINYFSWERKPLPDLLSRRGHHHAHHHLMAFGLWITSTHSILCTPLVVAAIVPTTMGHQTIQASAAEISTPYTQLPRFLLVAYRKCFSHDNKCLFGTQNFRSKLCLLYFLNGALIFIKRNHKLNHVFQRFTQQTPRMQNWTISSQSTE